MKELMCRNCGSPLRKEGEFLRCPYCDFLYDESDGEEAKAILDFLGEEKLESFYRAKRILYDATHVPYPSKEAVVDASRRVLSLDDKDGMALIYLHSHDRDPHELNLLLSSLTMSHDLAKEALRWMLPSLTSRTIGSMQDFVGRHFRDKERTDAFTAIETEAAKISEGVYETALPRDVFLCYSSADMKKVVPLLDTLEQNGFTCFAAFRNLRHGKGAQEDYLSAIKEAMRNCEVVVYLSSFASRSVGCDALKVELPYLIAELPNTHRIEYILEDYDNSTPYIVKKTLKKAFPSQEQCRDEEDLIDRIANYLDPEVPKESQEEKTKRLIEEALEKQRQDLLPREELKKPEPKETARQLDFPKAKEEIRGKITLSSGVPSSWNEVYCYAWNGSSSNAAWPGQKLVKSGDSYEGEISKTMSNVVFNNGGSEKTVDLPCRFDEPYSLGGKNDEGLYLDSLLWKEYERKRDEARKLQDALRKAKAAEELKKAQAEEALRKAKEEEEKKNAGPFGFHIANGKVIYGGYPQTRLPSRTGEFIGADGSAYRYEPIEWRVLGWKDGNLRLVSDKVLDCTNDHSFNRDGIHHAAVNFANGAIHSVAFRHDGGALIVPNFLGVKVELPSPIDLREKSFGWINDRDRIGIPTDYAMAKNPFRYDKTGGIRYLTSHFLSRGDGMFNYTIETAGYAGMYLSTSTSDMLGVRLVITLKVPDAYRKEVEVLVEKVKSNADKRFAAFHAEQARVVWNASVVPPSVSVPDSFHMGKYLVGPALGSDKRRLSRLPIKEEEVVDLDGTDYVKRDGAFYELAPLSWKIIVKEDDGYAIAITEEVIDASIFSDNGTVDYDRSALRRFVKEKIAPLALNIKEYRNFLVPLGNGDYVCPPSTDEMFAFAGCSWKDLNAPVSRYVAGQDGTYWLRDAPAIPEGNYYCSPDSNIRVLASSNTFGIRLVCRLRLDSNAPSLEGQLKLKMMENARKDLDLPSSNGPASKKSESEVKIAAGEEISASQFPGFPEVTIYRGATSFEFGYYPQGKAKISIFRKMKLKKIAPAEGVFEAGYRVSYGVRDGQFFAYKPIRWIIVRDTNRVIEAVSEQALLWWSFGDRDCTGYPDSDIRQYLNGVFLKNAFPLDYAKYLLPFDDGDLVHLPSSADIKALKNLGQDGGIITEYATWGFFPEGVNYFIEDSANKKGFAKIYDQRKGIELIEAGHRLGIRMKIRLIRKNQ